MHTMHLALGACTGYRCTLVFSVFNHWEIIPLLKCCLIAIPALDLANDSNYLICTDQLVVENTINIYSTFIPFVCLANI
jgi:hypothetical protein